MLLAALLLAANLSFPISDLGNCDSLSSCKTYCDIPWHETVCTDYGVSQGMLQRPQVLAAVDISYPVPELGNCGSKTACKAYCDTSANRSACVDFARAHGIDISVSASGGRAPAERPGGGGDLSGLTFPIAELGGCGSVQSCKIYCDLPANRQQCFDFAYEKGLTGGGGGAEKLSGLKFPIAELGNCGSMSECDAYCNQPDHHEQCDGFAKKMGFEPPGGGKMAGPGGCSTPEECDAYCSQPANQDECSASWEAHCGANPNKPECREGPPRGGPGGCGTEDECRAYCTANPNDEDCTRGREEWCVANPDDCWNPGGCTTDAECRAYCQQNPDDQECHRGRDEWCREHPDECREGDSGGGDDGPCHSNEDCQRYCQENPNSDYCRQADENWCRENPEECAAKEGEWDGSSGPGGPFGPDGPGGGPSDCGGMDCGEFCRLNPEAEYCVRMDASFCERNPDQCSQDGSGPGDDWDGSGPSEGGGYGPGGCATPEECDVYCLANPDDLECYPQ